MVRTYASAAPVMDTLRIAQQFHKSEIVGYLITSMFLLGYVFGPVVWGPCMFSLSVAQARESLMVYHSFRAVWASSSPHCGFLHISAHFHRPGVGPQYGNTSRDALLWRGLRVCCFGGRRWLPRRHVGRPRSDHPFRDFLHLSCHWPMCCDDSRWIVSPSQ